MTELRKAELRRRVVELARSWLGTPYHSHARVKGVGVDCAQILAAVYEDAGIVEHVDLGNSARQHHLHQQDELYLHWLEKCGARRISTAPEPGDIGVWKFGLTHSHGGIVIEGGADPLILHSYIKSRRGVTLCRASEAPLLGAESSQYWSII